jgi:hypothetical protein
LKQQFVFKKSDKNTGSMSFAENRQTSLALIERMFELFCEV